MKHIVMIGVVLVCVLCTPVAEAFSPDEAGAFLNTIPGLQTRGYKCDALGCYSASNYKMIDDQSNIAFYTKGTQQNVNKVYLVLNVYRNSSKKKCHQELLKAAKELAKNSIQYKLSSTIESSIIKGVSGEWKNDGYNIRIVRIDWPSGQGYEMKFFIEQL